MGYLKIPEFAMVLTSISPNITAAGKGARTKTADLLHWCPWTKPGSGRSPRLEFGHRFGHWKTRTGFEQAAS